MWMCVMSLGFGGLRPPPRARLRCSPVHDDNVPSCVVMMMCLRACVCPIIAPTQLLPAPTRTACSQFPQTSLREIATLKMLRHPNIVGLKEVVVGTERER